MQGRVIGGRYELRRKVGRGGMGEVWQAHDQSLQRTVAIKVMQVAETRNAGFRARFEQEARSLAKLQNPNVVQIHDYGVEADTPYIVMEMLAGEDLETRLRREGRLTPAQVLELVRQTVHGLSAAAGHGIVHRDIKPANLFLTTGATGVHEQVKLLDFGVARDVETAENLGLTQRGTLLGTPKYMSPEVIRGQQPTHQSDLWSLAVVAYRALSGRMPFEDTHFGGLIVSICVDPCPPIEEAGPLAARLDAFFERALAKDPTRRFGSSVELVQALTLACRETSTTTILAVDDEPDMANLLSLRFRKQIRNATYRFLFANGGDEAIELLRQHPDVDVVLSDINMPGMDGLELLDNIPALSPIARTVMVTAYGDMTNIRRAMNGGAFDFVVKPINFDDLQATIEKAARTVEAHRQMATSSDENLVLRQLVSSVLSRRLGTLPLDAALTTEPVHGTVMLIHVARASDDAISEDLASFARALNANYEVIVPLVRQSGGMIESIVSNELMCVWSGADQVERALDMLTEAERELAQLAATAGPGSPYAYGLSAAVASGHLLTTCVGSSAGRRFNYSIIGPALDESLDLIHCAEPGQYVVTQAVFERAPSRHRFEATELTSSSRARVYAFTSARGPRRRGEDETHTVTVTSVSSDALGVTRTVVDNGG